MEKQKSEDRIQNKKVYVIFMGVNQSEMIGWFPSGAWEPAQSRYFYGWG
jgi:hypothetical protein